jgi:hypothetical protein
MIVKYEISSYGYSIKRVEADRESQHCIWLGKNRRAKADTFFDTFDEAKAYLVDRAQKRLEAARLQLQRAQGEYGSAQGLKPLTNNPPSERGQDGWP